jgi:hypothetical protein
MNNNQRETDNSENNCWPAAQDQYQEEIGHARKEERM